MLHGMFGGLSNFEEMISHLPGKRPILVPELPLFAFERDRLSIPALANWLADKLVSLNMPRCHLLGNSLGGHVALEFTRRYPEKVLSLTLTGSSGLMEQGLGDTRPKRFDRDYVRKKAELTFFDLAVSEPLLDSIMEILGDRRKLINIIELARQAHRQSVESWLPTLSVPSLLIWGRHDRITPPEVAKTFFNLLPNAQLEWMERCGHAPMMEHPKPFAALLQPFLTAIESETETDTTTVVHYE